MKKITLATENGRQVEISRENYAGKDSIIARSGILGVIAVCPADSLPPSLSGKILPWIEKQTGLRFVRTSVD